MTRDSGKGEFVTLETCRDRHAATNWVLGVLSALTAVFLSGAIYAVNSANAAADKAQHVSATLESHMAAQAAAERFLTQRLDEIKIELRDDRVMLEEILKNGKGRKQ